MDTKAEGRAARLSAVDELRQYAEGRVRHLNRGICPDAIAGHASRDPECPVCRALVRLASEAKRGHESKLLWPAYPGDEPVIHNALMKIREGDTL